MVSTILFWSAARDKPEAEVQSVSPVGAFYTGSLRNETFNTTSASRRLRTRSIETIGLGDRVLAHNPLRHEVDTGLSEPNPATWRRIALWMTKADGSRLDIELLRPESWIAEAGASAGGSIHLSLPELQLDGAAKVVAISACPTIDDGPGRVVTGTFAHESADVVDLRFEGIEDPIGATANHPFWSVDRQEFLPGRWNGARGCCWPQATRRCSRAGCRGPGPRQSTT